MSWLFVARLSVLTLAATALNLQQPEVTGSSGNASFLSAATKHGNPTVNLHLQESQEASSKHRSAESALLNDKKLLELEERAAAEKVFLAEEVSSLAAKLKTVGSAASFLSATTRAFEPAINVHLQESTEASRKHATAEAALLHERKLLELEERAAAEKEFMTDQVASLVAKLKIAGSAASFLSATNYAGGPTINVHLQESEEASSRQRAIAESALVQEQTLLELEERAASEKEFMADQVASLAAKLKTAGSVASFLSATTHAGEPTINVHLQESVEASSKDAIAESTLVQEQKLLELEERTAVEKKFLADAVSSLAGKLQTATPSRK